MTDAPAPPFGAELGADIANDPELRLQHRRLHALLAYWEDKRGGRPMPSRADIRPAELVPHLPWLVLKEVESDPLRVRYRLIGTGIVSATGRDSTGRYADQVHPAPVLDVMNQGYRWMLDHRRPLRSHGGSFLPDRRFYRFEMLNLPLSRDGRQADMILGELIFLRAGSEAT